MEGEDKEWGEKYGEEGAKIIRECVNANLPDFEYLKSFAIKVQETSKATSDEKGTC